MPGVMKAMLIKVLDAGIKSPCSSHNQSQRNGGNKVWNMDKAFGDEQLWRNYIGAYYALVTGIDHCVGEILEAG